MNADFSDKVVMVTGASRGIGREIARQFADRGARIVVHFHKNRKAANQTLAELSGDSHLIFQADLSDATAVGTMTEKTMQVWEKSMFWSTMPVRMNFTLSQQQLLRIGNAVGKRPYSPT